VPPSVPHVSAEDDVEAGWDDPFDRPTIVPPESGLAHPANVASVKHTTPTARMPVVTIPVPLATESHARPVDPWGNAFEVPPDSGPRIELHEETEVGVGELELELIMEGEGDADDEASGEQLMTGWLGRTTQPPPHDPFGPSGDRLTPRPSGLLLEDRMLEMFSAGEFEAALGAALEILRTNPGAETAKDYAESCRSEIRSALISRLTSLQYIPRVAIPVHEIPRATLDHRTGFLLSRVDGWSTVEDVLDISGMEPIDALRILCHLLDEGIIGMHAR
jgi:hypothetical protein